MEELYVIALMYHAGFSIEKNYADGVKEMYENNSENELLIHLSKELTFIRSRLYSAAYRFSYT